MDHDQEFILLLLKIDKVFHHLLMITEEKNFNLANTNDSEWRRECRRFWSVQKCNQEWDSHSTFDKPEPIRMVDGVANRVDRLKAIGNGQVPLCAATAWRILSESL